MPRSGLLRGVRPTTLLANQLFSEELLHRCTVQVAVEGVTGGYGQPTLNWVDETTDVHCRLNWRSVKEKLWEFEGVVADYKLFVDIDVTVPETRQIVDVTDKDGNLIDAGPFDIISTQRFDRGPFDGQHHKELLLKRAARAGRGKG